MRGTRHGVPESVAGSSQTPRPRRLRRQPQDESSENSDDVEVSSTPVQPTSGRGIAAALRAVESISEQEVDRKVTNLVRLALFSELKKVPLRRDDINKKVLGEHTRAFPLVFERAQERLRNIFGMEMIEMLVRKRVTALGASGSVRRGTGRAAGSTSSTRFAIRNVLSREARRRAGIIKLDDEDAAQYGILAVMLSLIYVNSQTMPERQLIKYMEKLQPFDDIEGKLLPQFVKQGYLDRYKSDFFRGGSTGRGGGGDGPTCFEYTWGPRAKTEWDLDCLVHFIGKVFGADSPSDLRKSVEESGWTEVAVNTG